MTQTSAHASRPRCSVQARRITDSTKFSPKRFSEPKVLKFYKGVAWAFLAVLLAEVSRKGDALR